MRCILGVPVPLAGAALAILVAAGTADAATLDGFVRSRHAGESISHARITLTAEPLLGQGDAVDSGRRLIAHTNRAGYYSFERVPAGRFAVQVHAVGFVEATGSIVSAKPHTRQDFDLAVAPVRLPIVEVAGEPRRDRGTRHLPGFIEISSRQLQRLPAAGEQDLMRSLQLLPGVQAASDLSSGLYIRGGGPDQTLVLLDQIPLYNPTHAFGLFSTFDPGATQSVSLFKGAYPSSYGGRLGSVLDVANREGDRRQFRAAGGISLIAGRLTAEGPIRNGSWIVSARRTHLDPILDAVRTDSTEVPSYYFYDVNARLNRSLGPADKLVVSGYRGRDVLRLDLDRGSFLDIGWGNAAATAKWTHLFGPRALGSLMVSASEYRSDTQAEILGTPVRLANRLLDLGARADLGWRPSRAHEVNAGVSATLYRSRLEQAFNQVAQPTLDERPGSVALYAEDLWNPTPRWSLRPGLRAEIFGEGRSRRLGVEPRLSISRSLTSSLRVKAGGGGYTQHLQLVSTEGFSGADFWVPIDESTEAGRSWQSVLGVAWEPSGTYSLEIEGYHTWLRNLVHFDNRGTPDAGGTATDDTFLTGGRGWARGVELFARRRTGAVTGWIGYTLGWSRRGWPELNGGEMFPPKHDRRHDLKVVLHVKGRKWSYGANFLFGSGQPFTPPAARYEMTIPATDQNRDSFLLPGPKNSARLLPYHRLDLSVTRHGSLFGSKADYFLQIFNVYNRRNEWFLQYTTDGPVTEVEVIHQLPIVPTVGINFEF